MKKELIWLMPIFFIIAVTTLAQATIVKTNINLSISDSILTLNTEEEVYHFNITNGTMGEIIQQIILERNLIANCPEVDIRNITSEMLFRLNSSMNYYDLYTKAYGSNQKLEETLKNLREVCNETKVKEMETINTDLKTQISTLPTTGQVTKLTEEITDLKSSGQRGYLIGAVIAALIVFFVMKNKTSGIMRPEMQHPPAS